MVRRWLTRAILGFMALVFIAIATPYLLGILQVRMPATIILEKRRPPVFYDTQYEEMVKTANRPLLSESFGLWAETLAEPVAVIRAEGRTTTWEVFFATNRGLISSTAGSDQERFGNEHVPVPNYGRAEIMIPHRRRGIDPERSPANASTPGTDPSRFVQFDKVRAVPWEEMSAGINRQIEQSRQKDLLLFVHGFNVDFESALIRTAQVALDMPFNGAVVSYAWPSQGGVGNYRTDEEFNAHSVEPFLTFCKQLLVDVPEGTRVHVVVHSMGNRIVMQALSQLSPPSDRKPLATVALCAPDVGLTDFRRWAPGVMAQAEQVTLYASSGDAALIISKSKNQEQRAGDAHPPLVIAGMETIDVSAVDCSFLGHSYYGSNVDVLSDLFRLIKERRGLQTCAYLTPKESGGQRYWYFSGYGDEVHWAWHFEEKLRR